MIEFVTQIGESFVGEGADAAHVNTVLGVRGGAMEQAWVGALAHPSPGHTPFLVAAQPGLAVQPPTLFVNKATIASDRHGTFTWGAAQAGVARGVIDAFRGGLVDDASLRARLLLLVAVWVNPAATDDRAVFENNAAATRDALHSGAVGGPSWDAVAAARDDVWNAYFTQR